MRCERPSLAPMVVTTSVSGSRSTPQFRRYRSDTARRSFGMPLLAEYRWFLETWAASHSLSTAISGEGMSGLPKPRSMMSSPARRASILSWSVMVNTYGGRPVMRRNSIAKRGYPLPLAALTPLSVHRMARGGQPFDRRRPVDAGRRAHHRPGGAGFGEATQVRLDIVW